MTLNNDKQGRIAFIQSCWHKDIVDQSKTGFLEKIIELGISADLVDFQELPGAFELPLKCKQACKSGEYAVVIAAGFVVNGGIYQHEFVAQAVISGLMNVQLEQEVPVLSMVLTPQSFDDSEERHDFFFKHFRIKGHETAEAVKALLS
jgi:6,7-dimethyl-8-ribityllumazine synthase